MTQELSETVPCIWCATPTQDLATRHCDRCYVLAQTIGRYLDLTRRILRVNHDIETVKVRS